MVEEGRKGGNLGQYKWQCELLRAQEMDLPIASQFKN